MANAGAHHEVGRILGQRPHLLLALEDFPTGLLALRDVPAQGIAHAAKRGGQQIEFAQVGVHRCSFGQVERSDSLALSGQFGQRLRNPAGEAQRQQGGDKQGQKSNPGDESLIRAGGRNEV